MMYSKIVPIWTFDEEYTNLTARYPQDIINPAYVLTKIDWSAPSTIKGMKILLTFGPKTVTAPITKRNKPAETKNILKIIIKLQAYKEL